MKNSVLDGLLVHGRDNHAMEMILRLQSITRWHMIEMIRPQSVAEHSANVALLAMYIADTSPVFYFDPGTTVAAAALTHDMGEALIGDVAAHVKKALGGIKQIEDEVIHPVFRIPVNTDTQVLIKLCDIADCVRYAHRHSVDHFGKNAMQALWCQLLELLNTKVRLFDPLTGWPPHLVDHVKSCLFDYCFEFSGEVDVNDFKS